MGGLQGLLSELCFCGARGSQVLEDGLRRGESLKPWRSVSPAVELLFSCVFLSVGAGEVVQPPDRSGQREDVG